MFVLWIPYGILIMTTLGKFERTLGPLMFVLLIGYMVTLVVLSNMVWVRFRCPRCGSRFTAWGPWGMGYSSFKRQCRNCGLRKWQCD
jgi:hypothetical protein